MFTHTGYKTFQRCERQWYFKSIVADGRVKNDPFRKEVTILSKVDSLQAWRGKIVDDVVSRLFVNSINKNFSIDKSYLHNKADELFDCQLEYAAFQTYREINRKYLQDKNFAALYNYEFGLDYNDEELSIARNDIHFALNNLFEDTAFIKYLQSAKSLASQRSLHYQISGIPVSAKPDLIIFFDNSPPHIIDWKVHTYGIQTYDEQLILYAIALFKVAKTRIYDWLPNNISRYSIYDYKLTEYQLLHPDRIRRDYELTEDRLEQISDKVSEGIINMYMKGCHKKYGEIAVEDFETTYYIENCHNCPFKKICQPNEYGKI